MAAESTPASSHDNLLHKAIAGIFVTVVAPVLVMFGSKISEKVLTPPTPATASAPATAGAPTTPPDPSATAATAGATPAAVPVAGAPAVAAPVAVAPVAAAAAPVATPVVAPTTPVVASTTPVAAPAIANAPLATPTPAAAASAGTSSLALATASPPAEATHSKHHAGLPNFKRPTARPQRLFNGRDLTGFYTYLGRPDSEAKPYGKGNDPQKVFSVQGGLLRVSGETPGVLETVKEYSDYWLTVEYKWGNKTWPDDSEGARQSAILLNIDGADGALRGAFPAAFQVQLAEGAAGDLFVAAGQGEQHYSLTAAVEEKPGPGQTIAFYTPGAPRTTFTQGVIKRYAPAAHGRDATGSPADGEIERPAGEWNTLECVALNGKIWVRLNDHVVNFAIETTPAAGRIGIQSHGAEIFFREITLQPYQKHHDHSEQAAN